MSSPSDFYARVNGAAALPITDIVDGLGSELNPTIRSLDGVTTLSLISAYGGPVTLTFYA